MALPSDGRLPGMPALGTGCLGLGLRNSMSSIAFLVLGRRGRSTSDDVGREAGMVSSVSMGGTDSLLVVMAGYFKAAPVLGLSTLVAGGCWRLLEVAGISQTRSEELAGGSVTVSCSSQGSNYGEEWYDGDYKVSREVGGRGGFICEWHMTNSTTKRSFLTSSRHRKGIRRPFEC